MIQASRMSPPRTVMTHVVSSVVTMIETMRESALFSSLVTRALATQHSHYTKRDAHLRYRKPTEIVRVILLCVQLLKKSDPLHRDRPNREKELYTAPRRVACGASPRPPLTPSAYPSQRASWRNRRRQQLRPPRTQHLSLPRTPPPPPLTRLLAAALLALLGLVHLCKRCKPRAHRLSRASLQGSSRVAGIPSCCRGTLVRYPGQVPRSGTPVRHSVEHSVEQGAEAARRHTHLLQKL